MLRHAIASLVVLTASTVSAQNVLVCDQPNLSLRPNESNNCVTVRTLPATAGLTIQASFSSSFVSVSPTSVITDSNGEATFSITPVTVALLGSTVFFNESGGAFGSTQTDVICDVAKLTMQGTAGAYPGPFALELVANPGVGPFGIFGAIFLSPTFGQIPLFIFNGNDPRTLDVGPVGLQLPPGFSAPFFPPYDTLTVPSFNMPVLPGPATIYAHGTTLNFGGTGLFDRLSQAEPIYLAPSNTFSNRFKVMSVVRGFFEVIERTDQRMMVLGGAQGGILAQVPTNDCDVYDPFTDSWSTNATTMVEPRSMYTVTKLLNGRYLIVGGIDFSQGPQKTAEMYDPTSNTFTAVGSLSTDRFGHAATLLPNGQVLISGGLSCVCGGAGMAGVAATIGSAVASTEIFTLDASGCNGSFSPGPPMTRPRAGHTGFSLSDGRFYFIGGVGWVGTATLNFPTIWQETEFFDGTSFSNGPVMPTFRALGSIAQIGTSPDKWLIAGGLNSVSGAGAPTTRADIYTASANQPGVWSRAGDMSVARGFQAAYVYGDEVIQIGGIKGDLVTAATESTTDIYTISTGTWSNGPTMSTERGAYASYQNKLGVVHILGGATGPGTSPQVSRSTEWYHR